MRTRAIYGALLRCYPAAFREEYGSEMCRVFTEQLDETRQTKGRFAEAGLWAQAVADILLIAPQEHGHVIWQDLRYAGRTLAAQPGFAAGAILSLALGMGANTAIFSLWNSVLHASLPRVENPQALVLFTNPGKAGSWHGSLEGDRDWLSYAEFQQLKDQTRSFSGIMATQSGLAHWPVRVPGGGWEEAHERLVSGTFFPVLKVKPALGQVFTKEDDRTALPHAVISYGYWQRRFGGRADVLGATLRLSHTALTVIGVAPRGFIGETAGQQPDIWIPLQMQMSVVPGEDWLHETPPTKIMWLHVFGRLKSGITLQWAEAEANAIFQADLKSFYGSVASPERRRTLLNQRLRFHPGARGASEIRQDFSTSLTALLAAVGLLLFIACANLANLLLARGAVRRPEIALRLSLGASRSRLIRQLLAESFLLATLGGLTGLTVAYAIYGVLIRKIAQADRSFVMSFTLNAPVLCFTLLVILGAALLFGFLPAWHVTKSDIGLVLKEQGRGTLGSLGGRRWGPWLVSLQLALSLPLLCGAGLLSRTLYNLQHVHLGYNADHLLLVETDFRQPASSSDRHSNRTSLLRELLTRLKKVPGVRAVSFSQLGLFSGGYSTAEVEVEGYVPKKDGDRESALDRVGPNYFSTLGISLLGGREILDRDTASAPKVCVINQAFAERFFAGRNPLERHITNTGLGAVQSTYQIMGVARNARSQTLRGAIDPRYFVAMEQDLTSANYPVFLLRTARTTAALREAVRQVFSRVDTSLSAPSIHSFDEQVAPLTAQDRTTAQLAVVFGMVALTLAALGFYGVLSYNVAHRTGEIAVRLALGASPSRVIGMVLRETNRFVLVGLSAGTVLAYLASQLLKSRLFGVAPQDPWTLVAATIVLLLVTFAASFLPAWRASQLSPTAALRSE